MNTLFILLAIGAGGIWLAGKIMGQSIGQALLDYDDRFSDPYHYYLHGLDTDQGNTVQIKLRLDRVADKEQIFHNGKWYYLAGKLSTSVKKKHVQVRYDYYSNTAWDGPIERVALKFKIKK